MSLFEAKRVFLAERKCVSLIFEIYITLKKLIFIFIFLSFGSAIEAQVNNYRTQNNRENDGIYYTIKGSVLEDETRKPISRVNIEINGGAYTVTGLDGNFTIRAKIGDQLVVRHTDFETVYHTIKSNERIDIRIQSEQQASKKFSKQNIESFSVYIDSAKVYLKTDAEKSIQFVADALDNSNSTKNNATAHELLGDIYTYWKQHDLSITSYKISLQNKGTDSVKLKLAKAYMENQNYQESIDLYKSIKERKLSNYEKILRFEGLGDTYKKIKNYNKAIENYKKGLDIAQQKNIAPKETDLNSKIAETLAEEGKINKANVFYSNSLKLAERENPKRAAEEQVKAAEFNGFNSNYRNEIQLRKKAIKGIKDNQLDSILPNESPLTVQKQNYKIGNAYVLNQQIEEAIPYLEKSIEEADKKEDLVVKKDATRVLSDVLILSGKFEEAKAAFDAYKSTVDELYIKKEQEISQAARFSRNLTEKQNRIVSLESQRVLNESKYQLTQEQNKNQKIIIYSLIGGLILLLVTGVFMYKYIKQQKLANNLLALKSLRSQMNPHFIFNALNSVNSFIASNDERTANKYLTDFSFLMRTVLENSEEDFIPLQKEIELIALYTKLEHFRFKDKFTYDIEVSPDIKIEQFEIPPMLLQPYIENAVWHGLRYKKEKGHLHIKFLPKSESEIMIEITDNGIGRYQSKALKTANQKKQNSKGMNNIKKRVAILNEMYKDKVDVTVSDFQTEGDVGTKVVVLLKGN